MNGERERTRSVHRRTGAALLASMGMLASTAVLLALDDWRVADDARLMRSSVKAHAVAEGGIAGVGCGGTTLTQSTSPTVIEPINSVWCGNDDESAENVLARDFGVQPDGTTVTCVEFGIDRNDGPDFSIDVVLFSGAIGGGATPVEYFSTPVFIASGTTTQMFSVSFPPVAVPNGENLIVGLLSANRAAGTGGDGGLLAFGFNDDGESGPTYLRAPACGATTFFPTSVIGFPQSQLVMTVGVETGWTHACPPGDAINDCADAPLPLFAGEIASYDTSVANTDGPPASCASENDLWYAIDAADLVGVPAFEVGTIASAHEPAIAVYDLGVDPNVARNELPDRLVGCAGERTDGVESIVVATTPGHHYLVQIGSDVNGAGLPGGGIGDVYWTGDPDQSLLALACVPGPADLLPAPGTTGTRTRCVGLAWPEFVALQRVGAIQVGDCSACDPPGLFRPCLFPDASLVHYWPMELVSLPSSGQFGYEDRVGTADRLAPRLAGPSGPLTVDAVTGILADGARFQGDAAPDAAGPFPPASAVQFGGSSFSIAAWVVRPLGQDTTIAEQQGIIPGPGGGNANWTLRVLAGGQLEFRITSGDGSQGPTTETATTTATIPANTWVHVAMTVQRSTAPCVGAGSIVRFFIDCAETAPSPTILGTTLCGFESPTSFALGDTGLWLDEVSAYDDVLSPSAIAMLCAHGAAGFCFICPGDLNGDLLIDGADLGLVLGAFGSTDPSGDANEDGIVDGADIGVVLGAWGACP